MNIVQRGMSSLMWAVQNSNIRLVKILKDKGGDVDQQDNVCLHLYVIVLLFIR